MKKFVFVDSLGTPQQVACPSVDETYQRGQTYHGLLCLEVPYEVNNSILLSSTYWDGSDWQQRPERPSPHHTWSGSVWMDGRSLDDLKSEKRNEINAARLTANRGSFVYQNKEIAADELSRSDIDGINGIVSLTGELPPDWVGGWKAVDNTYVAISSVPEWIAFYGAMVTQGSANFAKAQALKALVDAAQTAEELSAIQW
jgi:hypothetical protein